MNSQHVTVDFLCVLFLVVAIALVHTGHGHELEITENCDLRFGDNGACACYSHVQWPLTCLQNGKIKIQPCSCVYYDKTHNRTVVGNCIFSCYEFSGTVMEITSSVEFNDEICSHYVYRNGSVHRTGQFCGQCNSSYGLAAYSYEIMQCIPCQDYGYKNWIKYFAVALLPLTVFYILAILLSFNISSSHINGVILIIQCVTSPLQMNFMANSDIQNIHLQIVFGILVSVLCTVNLDFFRFTYSPFCLHPEANVFQIMSLDYIVALYPFLLIFITYVLISAHDRQYRLVVWLWMPFKMCVHKYRNTWNIRTSLIEIFASFILLSSVKILGVSFQILTFTDTYDVAGNNLNKYYSAYNASIEYFSPTHLPYALLAIAISSIFVILPFLLLAVYPCRCFHKCLNHCGPRFQALHVFMDAFQGNYRTQPRDMRYFSAFYLFLRMLMLAQPQIFPSTMSLFSSGILSLASAVIVTIFQPYKVKTHNTMDTVMMFLMGIYFLSYYVNIILTTSPSHQWIIAAVVQGVSIITLFCYFASLVLWKLLHQKIKAMIRKVQEMWKSVGDHSNGEGIESFDHDRDIDITERNSYTPLLGYSHENPTY